MRYHVVLGRPTDFQAVATDAAAGKCPRNAMGMLAETLGAKVHWPGGRPVTAVDRIKSKLFGSPDSWALARALSQELSKDDVVFCNGEDTAIPIAAACGSKRDRPKVSTFAHNLDRPRGKVALKLYGMNNRIDLFITNIKSQVGFLRTYLSLPESRVHLIQDQTDRKFFTPGPPTPGKTRPIIASVGLEQRDYRTLAEATEDLDVDVRISGFSRDAAIQSRAFPDVLPANMSQKFYEWPELVQLYRDADVIAVSLFECKYSAGITTLMEGHSCRRPLVVTRTEGLVDYVDPHHVRITEPGNSAGLRQAIVGLLADRTEAEALADRGYELARERHDSDRFVAEIAGLLGSLEKP